MLSNLGIEYRTRHRDVRQGWIGIQCPDCGRGNEFYLGIHTDSLAANCWRCGPMKLYPILRGAGATRRALASLFKYRNATHSPDDGKYASRGKLRPPPAVPLRDAPRSFNRYLLHRGMNPTEIGDLWGVQAILPPHKKQWRLYIPVTYHGHTVSWTTRSINPDCPHNLRYISAAPDEEVVNLQSILYGMDYCTHSIVIVEGPTDAWAIGPGAAATLGMVVSPSQAALIASYPHRIIAFDNSPQAQRRARALKRRLEELPGRTSLFTFKGKDAATTESSDIQTLRKMLNE